jgi:tetratricopeptide (TPR) repeat protein
MYTLNGIGTKLYGDYQPHSGTHIATLWFTILFLPIWPLMAYLVKPAVGGGWYFLARAPFPPFASWMRLAVPGVVAACLVWFAVADYRSGSHVDLYVVNGFDRAVTVQVGDEERRVQPHDEIRLPSVPLQPLSLCAAWTESGTQIESVTVDFAGHGGELAVYNVAGRAVVLIDHLVYGPGTPKEDVFFGAEPVNFVDRKIDYVFTEAPDSLSVPEDGSVSKSVLAVLDERGDPAIGFRALLSEGRDDQALAMAEAELSVHPENATLAYMAASTVLSDDFSGQVELLRSCLKQAPGEVNLHRYYQNLWDENERGPLRREYAELLRANPESPMHHYLLGRIEETGSAAALAHYRAALDLDPDYAPVYRALGYEAIMRRDWLDALDAYDRFASFGGEAALEAAETRIRIRRVMGRSPSEIDGVTSQTRQLLNDSTALGFIAAHLNIERDPNTLTAAGDTVVAFVAASMPADFVRAYSGNWRADFALTAGDRDAARRALSLVDNPELRNASVCLRLALSEQATPDDRNMLFAIRGWFETLGWSRQMIALELLEPSERWQAIAQIDDAGIASIARALEDPVVLTQTARFEGLLSEQMLDVRAAAYFAAARRLKASTSAGAANARRLYLGRARAYSLPGELPIF